jgi:hypothetical protein
MSEKAILEQAFQRGKKDTEGHGHPGPDAVDVADLAAEMFKARGIPDFGAELSPHGNIANPIDTSAWTEADWDKYRQAEKKIHADVGDAYARGADVGRKGR